MKNLSILLIAFFILQVTTNLFGQEKYPVIPYPNKIITGSDEFIFKSSLTVTVANNFKPELDFISGVFKKEFYTDIIKSKNGQLTIRQNSSLGEEAYILNITKDGVEIESSTGTGCFYGIQTLRQLITLRGDGSYSIGACTILDYPAYSWRGFMLDESRRFYGMDVVKEILDQMALLKMNIFHWHLTDDQGWRIEIKKYPFLTEVGAWRDSTAWLVQSIIGKSGNSHRSDPFPHGGFYTQEDIKEIVAYAKKLHITIVPEIDVPGHASAAIASYPWLAPTSSDHKVSNKFGIRSHALDIGEERVIRFIEDVYGELMALFPGKFIHIGGDEVKNNTWKTSPAIDALMAQKGLKSYHDVQLYFTNYMCRFLEGKGRRMIGWNEILGDINMFKESNTELSTSLCRNAIPQFWKAMKGREKYFIGDGFDQAVANAAKKGYDVICSPGALYLYQLNEKAPLSRIYEYEPAPSSLTVEESKHILGVEACLWSEVIPDLKEYYLRVFPRIAAYAEVGWTQQPNKNLERFKGSLWKLKRSWDEEGILYYEKEENQIETNSY